MTLGPRWLAKTSRVLLYVGIALASVTPDAAGQPARAGGGWLSASAGFGGQPEGDVDCPRLCGPFGGASAIFAITAQVNVRSRTAFVVDTLVGPALEGVQQVRRVPSGFDDYTTTHRDVVTAVGLALRLAGSESAIDARMSVLAGLAFRNTSRVAATPNVPSTRLEAVVPALGLGLDFAIPVGGRVAIVPAGRVYALLERRDLGQPDGWRGVGGVLGAVSLGLAVKF